MKLNGMPRTVVLAAFAACLVIGCSSKTAEEKGQEMATEKIDMLKGIGTAMEEKGGAAAESVTSGVGSVLSGIRKGVAKSERRIANDPSLTSVGVQVTTVQNTLPGVENAGHGIEAYLVAERKAEGLLKVVVYDVLDNEIGRAKIPFALNADEGKYFHVPLEQQVELGKIEKVSFVFLAP